MRRATVPLLLTLVLLLLLAPTAGARLKWCKADPVVMLDGTSVQIWVAVPDEYAPVVDGPVRVEVVTPESVAREVTYTDPGFNGHGEEVTFSDLSSRDRGARFPVQIRVSVPVDEARLGGRSDVPVRVEVIPENGAGKVTRGTHRLTAVGLSLAGR